MKGVNTFTVLLIAVLVWWLYGSFTHNIVDVDTHLFDKPTGEFTTLSRGIVHYQWYGPPDGKLVLLIHGISSNGDLMRWLAADIAKEKGFSVLTYDIYGRGLSSSPTDVIYDEELFIEQIIDLLRVLGKDKDPLNIVGYSMGGAIAALYIERYPDLVRNLVLISPAGTPFELPLAGRITQIPYVGEFVAQLRWVKEVLVERAREAFIAPHLYPEQYEYLQMLTMYHVHKKEGFLNAMVSTLRHFPLNNCTHHFKQIGLLQPKLPVLLVWGDKDTTTPFEGHKTILELIPHAEFLRIDGANHAAVLEHPTVVHPKVVNFLKVNKRN